MLEKQLPTDTSQLHHAYLVRGAGESALTELEAYLSDVLAMPSGHPDVYRYDEDKLSIATAREIQRTQSTRPVRGSRTVFIIRVREQIPVEAQNALLKVLEDPSATTVFFLLVPQHARILDTVYSRVHAVEYTGEATESAIAPDAFLGSKPAQRLSLLADVIKNKDRQQLQSLVDALEVSVAAGWREHEYDKSRQEVLELLAEVKEYVADPGSSPKLLAEHMAVTLPVIDQSV